MNLEGTSGGILQKEFWRNRIQYNQSQKDILQSWFQHDPFPDKAAREQLAKEIGVPESNIQVWFKNYRVKQRKLDYKCFSEKDQTQGHDQSQHLTQEYLPKEARQKQTFITWTQKNRLVQAFERNPFPDIATRKKLAEQTGLQESRIQMWFQKQRSLYLKKSRMEPVNLLVDDPNERPDATVGWHPINLFLLPDSSHYFSCSNSSSGHETLPPVLPSTQAPWDPFGFHVSQGPNVMIMQPTQAVQEGEDSDQPLIIPNHLLTLPILTKDLDTPTPFWLQYQEEHQNHKEHTGSGVPQVKSHSQPEPEHREQQPLNLGQFDISNILQRWDEICQALLAEWDPLKGTH
ncbi:double homeobox protein B [Gorilla gorilla gorilla]|uniref:Double homeobox B n=1 Tax=Gorilla gorilla gorilla TaxID=9595 RepID=A0A2I2ZA34_GORGO|nr:double homeobox protein B [Gorilla gorilla gorilla]